MFPVTAEGKNLRNKQKEEQRIQMKNKE